MADESNTIAEVVEAWLAGAPDAADRLLALPKEQRRAALSRLGYDTQWHLEMFGL